MYQLATLGFGPFFEGQLPLSDGEPVIPARIAAEHRGGYEVWSSRGLGRAQLVGRLRLELEADGTPGVGDWVVLKDSPGPNHITVIERVLTRRTVFTRGAAGREVVQGIEAVRASIHDSMTVALVDSSGTGKSTLVNALLGEGRLRTGEVRVGDR